VIHDADLARRLAPLARTVENVFPEKELLAKLGRKKPLRVKFGIDPTSTSVHIGNGIPLWNLRRLQDLGHQAVLIVGDYTATVGDPSGKDKTRPMLTLAQVESNFASWQEQIARILDWPKVEVRRNGEWFSKMTFLEVLALADRMTVQQMMERENFAARWKVQTPISVREFLYCLMQGWDSVMVDADVELGGTDQTFNLTVGRRLMEQAGKEPQVCLISPLLEGTDGGEKMSKSLGNAIGLTEPPKDMFGKAMRVSDALLPKYLRLASGLPDAGIDALLAGPPMQAKLAMAEGLVDRYHGREAAAAAREEFLRVISRGEMPSEVPEAIVTPGERFVYALLRDAGLAPSNSQARDLLKQKGVTIHPGSGAQRGEAQKPDETSKWAPATGDILQVGSRRYVRLRVDPLPGA
jgi:tyrosyl-tRNA synthetase